MDRFHHRSLRIVRNAVGLGILGGVVLLTPDPSLAQDKHKIAWSTKAENTKVTVQQVFEIPDMPGHILRAMEIRRTWPDGGAPVMEGQTVVEEVTRGVRDLVAGNGRSWGYSTWHFENGDLVFYEPQTAIQTLVSPDGSQKTTFVGTYVTTGGTGKLKGVRGVGRLSGVAEIDAEGKLTRNEYSAEGEWWFEK